MWTTVALTLVGEPRLVDDATVPLDGGHVQLDDGLAFEITDGKGGPRVGWAFVGDADWLVDVPDSGDALALSTAMALPKVRAEGQLRESLDLMLVIADDAELLAQVDAWPVVKRDRGSLVWTDAEGMDHVYVSSLRPNSAQATARGALERRTLRLAHTGLDPRVMLAQERMRSGPRRALVEARTERSWLPMIEPAFGTGGDRWLTWVRDPTGMVDDSYRSVVAVHGVGENESVRWRVLTGVRHVAVVDRAEITEGLANAVLTMTSTGRGVVVESAARLTVQSSRATELLHLAVPKATSDFRQGMLHVPPELRITELSLDGEPLTQLGVPWGPFAVDDTVALSSWQLPRALEPGEPVVVDMRWRQQWRASNQLDVGQALEDAVGIQESAAGSQGTQPGVMSEATRFKRAGAMGPLPELVELGRVTSGHALMPQVPGTRRPYPTRLRLGSATPSRWKAAIGSGRVEQMAQGEGQWVSAEVPSDAHIAFGDYREAVASALGGFPEVRVLSHSGVKGGDPTFVRSVVNFYQRVLGDYPFDVVSVVEGAHRPMLLAAPVDQDGNALRPEVQAHPGQAVLVSLRSFMARPETSQVLRRHPKALERGLAHALALDFWRDRPWTGRDAWIPLALSALYRDRFVHHAYGSEVGDAWRTSDDLVLGDLPDDTLVPIVGSRDARAPEIAARLLGDALRHRIGEPKLLEALHRYHLSGDATLAGLQAQLESVSGESLDGFFDTWFVAGIRPSVEGRWRRTKEGIEVSLASDVPQAALGVPVRVVCRKSTRTHWVDLREGRGQLRAACVGPKEVAVDPEGWLPLRSRELVEDEGRGSTRGRKSSRRGTEEPGVDRRRLVN
ncbi:MAG: hypothetical protein KTR31_36750 [Myxococcales bacterium]|nr:hypothetical protein [Myxococcales bacterium]